MTDLSPYILPEGNVHIAFSGGRTSAYMLHQIMAANGGLPDRAKVIFTNTGRELEPTLEFVREVERQWGVPIVWLEYRYDNGPRAQQVFFETAHRRKDPKPFNDLLRRKKRLPNQQERFCTEELKVRTARRWLVMQGWKKWTKESIVEGMPEIPMQLRKRIAGFMGMINISTVFLAWAKRTRTSLYQFVMAEGYIKRRARSEDDRVDRPEFLLRCLPCSKWIYALSKFFSHSL